MNDQDLCVYLIGDRRWAGDGRRWEAGGRRQEMGRRQEYLPDWENEGDSQEAGDGQHIVQPDGAWGGTDLKL